MIEFAKEILFKVSFDKNLFNRELLKFLNLIPTSEIPAFKEWTYNKFSDQYQDSIDSAFNKYLLK